jgi:ABC-type multidrug transport system ATPase subunit
VLAARNVEVTVEGGTRILGPVSLEVAPGKLVALMGPSGSGKSTLLRVLAGISPPTAGAATWAATDAVEAAHELGYVPQRESVHDRLTPREALSYAARLRLDQETAADGRVERVLAELDLVDQADVLIRNLSGGERRRAACGLELVGNPQALLLDEPTSGLDLVLERRLMEIFRQLADHGRAVLVATHATASLDLCDEVIVLDHGHAAERGEPATVRTHLETVAQRAPAAPERTPDDVSARPPVGRLGAGRSLAAEFRALTSRYYLTLMRDHRTLAVLIGQAAVIAVLISILFGPGALSPGASAIDGVELILMLMTATIWLGASAACREVVKERGLVEREFDFGVRLEAYVLAKAVVLCGLAVAQVVLLVTVLTILQPLYAGSSATVNVFLLAILTSWASVAIGLAASCVARSVDQAAGVLPLLLMPQLLFAGGLIPTAQMPAAVRAFSNIVFARWSYAGLGSAVNLGPRVTNDAASTAVGFSNSFFTLSVGTAAVILIGFTLVTLLAAILLLMNRPPVDS